jgi:hypothetical protein
MMVHVLYFPGLDRHFKDAHMVVFVEDLLNCFHAVSCRRISAPSTIAGILPEISEHTEFKGAEKSLQAQEAEANQEHFAGIKLVRHKFSLREFTEFEQGSFLQGNVQVFDIIPCLTNTNNRSYCSCFPN